jgi:hypothetical protein
MVKYCHYCGAPNEDDAKFCIKCGHQFPEEEQVSQQPPQQIAQPSPQPIQQTARPSQQQIPTSTPKQTKENDIDINFWILVILLFILSIIGFIFSGNIGILGFFMIILVIIWGINEIVKNSKSRKKFLNEYYQEIIDKLNQLIDQLSQNKSR